VPPAILNDPEAARFVETILADAQYQKARADSAEAQVQGWKKQAGEWKGLFDDATARAELLKGATVDRKEAGDSCMVAVKSYQDQVAASDKRIAQLEADLYKAQHPGILKELFSPKELLKMGVAYGAGRVSGH
jgi:hypothetical protein